jgi:hypothetical protein
MSPRVEAALHAASEAATAPAVKMSAASATVAAGAGWWTPDPALIALLGLGFTAATFAVNLWFGLRRNIRAEAERAEAHEIHEIKLRRLQAGLDTDVAPLDGG